MDNNLKEGQVFALKDLLSYEEGKVVKKELLQGSELKLMGIALAAGTELKEHEAPVDALIFALEGKGIMGCGGQEYPLEAGQNFKLNKGSLHYVKADGPFKMAVLLIKA